MTLTPGRRPGSDPRESRKARALGPKRPVLSTAKGMKAEASTPADRSGSSYLSFLAFSAAFDAASWTSLLPFLLAVIVEGDVTVTSSNRKPVPVFNLMSARCCVVSLIETSVVTAPSPKSLMSSWTKDAMTVLWRPILGNWH